MGWQPHAGPSDMMTSLKTPEDREKSEFRESMIAAMRDDGTMLLQTVSMSGGLPVQECNFGGEWQDMGISPLDAAKALMAPVNRTVDATIIDALDVCPHNTGPAAPPSVLVERAMAEIGGTDERVSALITPAFDDCMNEESDYRNAPFVHLGAGMARLWRGVNWIVHPRLPGCISGPSKCFMYRRSAIAYCMDTDIDARFHRSEEYRETYGRVSIFMGANISDIKGVAVMVHDKKATVA